jgi:hypothetical protein
MGRGRQKAKQTKVARELKYHTPSTDFDALKRELAGVPATPVAPPPQVDDDEDDYSAYSAYVEDDDDEPAGGYASRSSRR